MAAHRSCRGFWALVTICVLVVVVVQQVSAFKVTAPQQPRFFAARSAGSCRCCSNINVNINMDQRIRGHRSTRATRATTRMDSAADARHPQSPGVQSSAEAGEGAGAGIEAPVPPPAAAVPCYRRLYNSAMRALEGEMELQPYPIPEGLEGNAAVVGKGRSEQSVKTSITAFRAPKLRQIRAALVETDGPTQVLNFVIFPDPSYNMPIFGADLVSLPGVHLVCIDLQPAFASQFLDERTSALLLEAKRQHSETFPWGGDLPEAAQKFFSPHCLWSKIGAGEAVEESALAAMMDYLKVYLGLAADAQPEAGEGTVVAQMRKGQAEYCKYRRENDPARGMLTRFYGSEWTEAAIEGILFDFPGAVASS